MESEATSAESASNSDDGRAVLAAFYNPAVVTQYSSMMEEEMKKYSEDFARLFEDLPAQCDGPILDTSCGTGHMLAALHGDHPDRALRGVDIAPAMVEEAKQRVPAAEIGLGSMAAMPEIESSSVAVLLSCFALHHVCEDTAKRCFTEWSRVLQSGGRLLVALWEGEGAMEMPVDDGTGESEASPEQLEIAAMTTASPDMNRWRKEQIRAWASAASLVPLHEREFLEEEFGNENTYYGIYVKE